jgi:hypothetical protein
MNLIHSGKGRCTVAGALGHIRIFERLELPI